MPTSAKLVAALFFAALGWFCADLVAALLPEGMSSGLLNEVCAAIGAVVGITMLGKRAGDGLRAALGYGLTTSALLAFWGIFAFAFTDMLSNSLDKRYHGAVEAIQAMVGIGMDYAVMIATPSILGALIVGGLFGGWLTEWVARRWS